MECFSIAQTELADKKDKPEDKKKKKGLFGIGYYTIILISIFVGQVFCCCGMCAWVGKQVKSNDEEVINEQAQYYQLLLNFWKELENDRDLKQKISKQSEGTGSMTNMSSSQKKRR